MFVSCVRATTVLQQYGVYDLVKDASEVGDSRVYIPVTGVIRTISQRRSAHEYNHVHGDFSCLRGTTPDG